jgi:hypothetical protein
MNDRAGVDPRPDDLPSGQAGRRERLTAEPTGQRSCNVGVAPTFVPDET